MCEVGGTMTIRSRFLTEALRCFESSDSRGLFDLANAFDIEATSRQVECLSEHDNEILNAMAEELRRLQGEALTTKRLSLSARPNADLSRIVVGHIRKLSPAGQRIMREAFVTVLSSETPL